MRNSDSNSSRYSKSIKAASAHGSFSTLWVSSWGSVGGPRSKHPLMLGHIGGIDGPRQSTQKTKAQEQEINLANRNANHCTKTGRFIFLSCLSTTVVRTSSSTASKGALPECFQYKPEQ